MDVHPVLERVLKIGGSRVKPSPDNDYWSICLNRSGKPRRVVTFDKDETFAHMTIARDDKETCLRQWNLEGKAKSKRQQASGGWVFYLTIKDFVHMSDEFVDFIISSRAKI